MKRFLVSVLCSGAALALIVGPPANANPYDRFAGMTYAQLKERYSRTITIATRIGEYLPTEQCMVTGARSQSGGNALLVDLNCNDPRSAGGDGSDHAGYSVATPEGRKISALKDRAASLSKNYETALAAGKSPGCEKYYDSCVRICQQSGACSAELLEYLGI